jgi:hypothetical protein
MTSSLNETIKSFSNQFLIEQYKLHADQYMDEAIKLMEGELKVRGIGEDEIAKVLGSDNDADAEAPVIVNYDKKLFSPLDGGFSTNDSLLVRSMFAEHKIPFFMDTSSSILPFMGEELDAHLVAFNVHNDWLERAKSIIDEHFILTDKRYTLNFSDVKARLKSLNFYEIPHSVLESKEIVEVGFSKAEKEVIITFGSRLLNEADAIEAQQNRVVFYYDNTEDLIARLANEAPLSLNHTDLLTALEILQIYCDEPDFPPAAIGIIEALLGFFLPHQPGPVQ